jgi:sugar phosphate isomerase/epimerase
MPRIFVVDRGNKRRRDILFAIGLSSVFFRERFDPEIHLPLMVETGIALVELSHNAYPWLSQKRAFREFRRAVVSSGIAINSIHLPFGSDFDLSSNEAKIRDATIQAGLMCVERLDGLKGKYLVVHPGLEPVGDRERGDKIRVSAQSLARIVHAIPPSSAVKVALECLPRTCLCHNSKEHLALIRRLAAKRVGVCLDANHANLQEDLVKATLNYGSRILTTHVSDNDGIDERHWLPGKGIIPWRKWIKALSAIKYAGPLVYEVYPSEKPGTTEEWAGALRGIREYAERVFGALPLA